ncbi:MAG: hypothetical protein J5529_04985 [Prevotella sp.]|nr:hypothetical protein [Prevotella sp.]
MDNDSKLSVSDVTMLVDAILNGPKYDLSCPDANHPHAIDLGLPSGTLWSCCNLGASTPEEYGGYYAWGETEQKEVYDWSTYMYYNNSDGSCRNLGSDIVGTPYDVAHVKWGGTWVMPSKDQIQELLDNCTSEWIMFNGVKGLQLMSKNNDGTIFLPVAGHRWVDNLNSAGNYGYYWSSTQFPSYSFYAYLLYFNSDGAHSFYSICRDYGQSVRPVSK